MFFANGYVEADHQQQQQGQPGQQAQHSQSQMPPRRLPQCSSDENDILRELLLDGDFSSPRHFALTPSKPSTSGFLSSSSSTAVASTPSILKRHHVEISIPQICFDSSTLLRSTPSLLNRSLCMLPSPSPMSQQQQQQLPPTSASIINSIISPPRVFIQDFGHFPPRPFFHDSAPGGLDSELQDVKPLVLQQPQPPLSLSTPLSTRSAVGASFAAAPCLLPPPPLPLLSMPPLKNKRPKLSSAPPPPAPPSVGTGANSTSGSTSSSVGIGIGGIGSLNGGIGEGASTPAANGLERKQLRCTHPGCPNLRRSAGFCNRHSGKVCSVADCLKSALSRGKCPEHGGGSRCKKDGCFKFAQTRGLCKSHGGGRQCNMPNCTKNAHQNRLCRSHGGGKRCEFERCTKWAQRSGYCCAHTKAAPGESAPSSQHSSPHLEPMSAASSPMGVALPMPSPTLMSPHHLLSMLP